MKFLRVIMFDESDRSVFERAAEPDEWAVSGAFAFVGLEDDMFTGKTRQAFANGFLGAETFGRSTFAFVAEMTAEEEKKVLTSLAEHFVADYGAPSVEEALPVAHDEVKFVRELCSEKPINTVFTVRRTRGDDGTIREEFREITPPDQQPRHTRIWEVVEDEA